MVVRGRRFFNKKRFGICVANGRTLEVLGEQESKEAMQTITAIAEPECFLFEKMRLALFYRGVIPNGLNLEGVDVVVVLRVLSLVSNFPIIFLPSIHCGLMSESVVCTRH